LLLLVVSFKQSNVSLEHKYNLGKGTLRCTFISNVLYFFLHMKTDHTHMFCERTNILTCSKMSIKRITKRIGGLSVNVRCEIMLSVFEGKIRHVCVCCMLQNVEI
jgi:hypothetical protein